MNKQAINLDPATIARYAAGGAMVGGGTSAILNLAHMVRQLREERAKALKPTETDENTIVITLPKKAEVLPADGKKATTVVNKSGSSAEDYQLNRGGKQSRKLMSQQFGPKLAMDKSGATGWPTLTAATLAALGGGAGGALVINKLYEAQRERRLKQELEAAKQDYMSVLSGHPVKGASILDETFAFDGSEKSADTFGMLNYPLAAAAVLTLLGGGATGYLTKKILDEKLRAANEQSTDLPKVKRIVFKTEQEPNVAKHASADDCGTILAGLMVMMDKVGGVNRFTGSPEVQEELKKAGMTAEELVKKADDFDVLTSSLEANPELRKSVLGLANHYMTKNPMVRGLNRMGLGIPAARRAAEGKLYAALDKLHYGVPAGGMSNLKVSQDVASLGLSVGSSLLGKNLSQKAMTPEQLADVMARAQEEVKTRQLTANTKEPDEVQVISEGPQATKYLTTNQKKIQAVIKRLAAEGQL